MLESLSLFFLCSFFSGVSKDLSMSIVLFYLSNILDVRRCEACLEKLVKRDGQLSQTHRKHILRKMGDIVNIYI